MEEQRDQQGDLPFASSAAVVELIGEYAIVREISRTDDAVIYACRDQKLDRDVAIKILREDALEDDVAVQRFEREGQLLAKIDSPHVVRIFQVGRHGKVPYLVMELVDGAAAEGPLEVPRALEIARQMASALQAAHDAGVVHRDVQPKNVLLTSTGTAKLTGFGVAAPADGSARLTKAGIVPGATAYLSPERIRGASDARSDVYSLGCTLYALITGKPPFVRESALDVVAAHLGEPAPRLENVPDHVADLVDLMLYKDPARRPQSAREVVDKLKGPSLADKIEQVLSTTSPAPADTSPRGVADPLAATIVDVPLPTAEQLFAEPVPTGVTGSLARMSLAEILQTLEQNAGTALVELKSADGDDGAVAVRKGRLVYASLGAKTGEEAFFALMTWKQGKFHIQYDRESDAKNLDVAPQAIMLEAFRRIDEAKPKSTDSDWSLSAIKPEPKSQSSTWMLESSAALKPVDNTVTKAIEQPDLSSTGAIPFATGAILITQTAEQPLPTAPQGVPAPSLRERWLELSPKTRLAAALSVFVVVIVLLIAALAGDDGRGTARKPADDNRMQRIANGEERAVLAEIEAKGPAASPEDERIRGHALVKTGDKDGAVLAFGRAARGGAVDDAALGIVLVALNNESPAADAINAVAAWPKSSELKAKLEKIVSDGEWWERHHALLALEKRGEGGDVDATALWIRDLREGPTCNKRKHGLTMLKASGVGERAIAAVDEAERNKGANNCVWRGEWEATRKAIRSRSK